MLASRSPQCLLADLASIQQAYVNTGHPDFIGGRQAIEAVFTHFQMLRQEQWVNKEQAIVHDAPDSTQTHTDIQQNVFGAVNRLQVSFLAFTTTSLSSNRR
jgi:hypothetical protein